MLIKDGQPAAVKAITFPNDTTRTLSVRFRSDKDTSATVVYTIGPEVQNVTFADGSRQFSPPNAVAITPFGVDVSTSFTFVKTNAGPVVQIPVTGVLTEKGGASAPPVSWFVGVVQTVAPVTKAAVFSATAVGIELNELDRPDPLDRTELLQAARVLRTLQAAVDAALADDSRASDSTSETES